jgi:hypothetical protein
LHLQENGVQISLRRVLRLLGHGRLLPYGAQPEAKHQNKDYRSRRFHGGTLLQNTQM